MIWYDMIWYKYGMNMIWVIWMWYECGMNDRNIVWIMALIIYRCNIYEYGINDMNHGMNVIWCMNECGVIEYGRPDYAWPMNVDADWNCGRTWSARISLMYTGRLDVNIIGFVNKTHHKLYGTRFVQLTLRKKPMAKPGWYRQVFWPKPFP